MSLLIGSKIDELMAGYPTISDKYDVAPAVLEGATAVKAGTAVMVGSTTGRYTAVSGISDASKIAGFVLASNAKVPGTYPAAADVQEYAAGEAFNLMFKGGIAVILDADNTEVASIAEGVKLTISADGKLGTKGAITLDNCVFTGVVETKGDLILAEVIVK